MPTLCDMCMHTSGLHVWKSKGTYYKKFYMCNFPSMGPRVYSMAHLECRKCHSPAQEDILSGFQGKKKTNQNCLLVAQLVEVFFFWLLLMFSAYPLQWTITPKQQHALSDQNISDINSIG